jgi:hypothetical protein
MFVSIHEICNWNKNKSNGTANVDFFFETKVAMMVVLAVTLGVALLYVPHFPKQDDRVQSYGVDLPFWDVKDDYLGENWQFKFSPRTYLPISIQTTLNADRFA